VWSKQKETNASLQTVELSLAYKDSREHIGIIYLLLVSFTLKRFRSLLNHHRVTSGVHQLKVYTV